MQFLKIRRNQAVGMIRINFLQIWPIRVSIFFVIFRSSKSHRSLNVQGFLYSSHFVVRVFLSYLKFQIYFYVCFMVGFCQFLAYFQSRYLDYLVKIDCEWRNFWPVEIKLIAQFCLHFKNQVSTCSLNY